MEFNKIYNEDCIEGMRKLPSNSINLTVTSPPYDNLRQYNGYAFNFEETADEIYRVTQLGGVVVWVVGDSTKNGSESLTSFRQALYFKETGFKLHDTMIWNKGNFTATGSLKIRYAPVFEYMFILSKGKPKSFNPIKDRKNLHYGTYQHGTVVQIDGSKKQVSSHNKKPFLEYGQRHNIWNITPCKQRINHPARFPEQLAEDHIMSWSNKGEIVLDPFMGSGTTAVAAVKTNRNYIGFEISKEYCDIAQKRIGELKNGI